MTTRAPADPPSVPDTASTPVAIGTRRTPRRAAPALAALAAAALAGGTLVGGTPSPAAGLPHTAAACAPAFVVDETRALVPGETLHISGTCFTPGQRLAVKMDADSYGQIGADDGEDAPYRTRGRVQVGPDGTFTAEPMVVPRFQPANAMATTTGSHTLHLLDDAPVTSVRAGFEVVAEHAASARVEEDRLVVTGTGFRDRAGTGGSRVALQLWVDGRVLTRPGSHAPHADPRFWAVGAADATGAFTLTTTLPDGGTLGPRGSVPAAAGHVQVRLYTGRELTGTALDLTRHLPLTEVTLAPAPRMAASATLSGHARPGGVLRVVADFAPAAERVAVRWLRDGTPIEGATAATYRPVPADVGARLRAEVTGESAGHAPTTATSAELTATAGVLAGRTRPTVTGAARVGRTLRATRGAWAPSARTRVQWLRDGRPIAGATTLRHRVVAADRGHRLRVLVTATRAGYAPATATSAPVRVRRG